MRTALRKVRRDLWNNKGRTLLVVLSIAVGVLAVGMIITSSTILSNQMRQAHLSSNPSHAHVFLFAPVDAATLRSLERTPGVAKIQGFTDTGIRWKLSPDEEEWRDGSLVMIDDYEHQVFDQYTLRAGGWPSAQAVAVEHNHIGSFAAPPLGGTVYFEVNERPRPMSVGGVLRDPFHFPSPFDSQAAFYVTPDVLERLTGVVGYDTLRVTLTDFSEENQDIVLDELGQRLEKLDNGVAFSFELHPERHFLQETIDGVNLVLQVMAVASLGLSTFLVINTMNALITQQIPQIGIMKAVGGLRNQIANLYLAGVATYGLLALLVAVPIGALGGDALSRWMLGLLNVPAPDVAILPQVFVLQIATGMMTPILAALYPVLRGVGIAVAVALRERGLGSGKYGTSLVDRIVGRVQGLPRLATLALRNTFRRPGRVALTMVTLVAAGAIFIMVISTQHSFLFTIDKAFKSFGFEVLVGFEQNQRIDEIVPLIESRPNVEFAEMWLYAGGKTHKVGASGPGTEFDIFPRGVPGDSRLYEPELTAGRVLHPDDGRALLLNQKLAGRMDVEVGDQIVLDMGDDGESVWTVVGLVLDLGGRDQDTAFMNRDTLAKVVNRVGQASTAQVRASEQTLAMQKAVEKDLLDFFEAQGIGISFSDTALENREQANAQFNVLTTVLLIMTILMAVVGSMGLSGTLSINVIERRREIGVMRAVGASSRDVGRIFSGEGLMLGLVSWLQAAPLGLLAAPPFVRAIGNIIDFPVEYSPSFDGLWIWFVVVLVLSLVASWLPARRATQISVNESLAYE